MKTLLFLIPLYLLPMVVHSDVVLTVLIFTFVLSILAVGFNIVFGGAGQLTMFHAAAFGIGGYVTFLSMLRFGIPFWLGFLVAVGIVIVVSIVIGWICFKFRLKEFYFAVVTLAFAELCRLVVLNWTSVTNGTLVAGGATIHWAGAGIYPDGHAAGEFLNVLAGDVAGNGTANHGGQLYARAGNVTIANALMQS